MKHLAFISLGLIMLFSCKKHDTHFSGPEYLQQAWRYLKDSLSKSDFKAIDFDKSTVIDNVEGRYLYVPYSSQRTSNQFVLLQIYPDGKPFQGRIISIERSRGGSNRYQFDGAISISSMNRHSTLRSEIVKGYILAFRQRNMYLSSNAAGDVHPDPAQYLPECVVVGYKNSNYGTPYLIELLRYSSMFTASNNQSYGSYSPLDPYSYYLTGGGYSYPSGNTGGGNAGNQISDYSSSLVIEYDHIADRPIVDINKLFRCYDYIPSPGASYTMKLCTDLPVNNNPFASVDHASKGNAGHVYITLSKSNGSQSVTQSFGFYPASPLSMFDPFSETRGAIKDNGATEINASIEVKISEAQFNTVRSNAIASASFPYSLADHNCADYAINLFNLVSTFKVSTDPLTLPLGTADPYNPTSLRSVQIPKSPQMLFVKLQELKLWGQVPQESIVVDKSHNFFSPVSKGMCN